MTRPSINVKLVGREQLPVVVIDNCLADPSAWRSRAVDGAYDVVGGFYPGVRSMVPVEYGAEIRPILSRVLAGVFGFTESGRIDRAYFSIITTDAKRLHIAQRIPHIDGVHRGLIAIVHYLAKNDQGGTAFYRHRTTGYESIDESRHPHYLNALREDLKRHGEPPAAYINGDTDLYERTAYFDGRYNRALIYPSRLLHCSAARMQEGFSSSPALGRLTISGFISAS